MIRGSFGVNEVPRVPGLVIMKGNERSGLINQVGRVYSVEIKIAIFS